MKKYILILSFLFAVVLQSAGTNLFNASREQLLDSLDFALLHFDEFVAQKESVINGLTRDFNRANALESKTLLARDIYNSYSSLNPDSTIKYADVCINLARQSGDTTIVDEANIMKSYIFAATGQFSEAKKSLDAVAPPSLELSLYLDYSEKSLFLQTHSDQFLGYSSDTAPYTADTDSLLQRLVKMVPDSLVDISSKYFWFAAWHSLRSPDTAKELIPELREALSQRNFNTRRDAMDAWMLSQMYMLTSDDLNWSRFLIISAIADIRSANREIASLEELAAFLFEHGEVTRANDYITFCIKCANTFKSRVRIGRLAELQYLISDQLQQKTEKQQRTITNYLLWMIVALVLLSAACCLIVFQLKRLQSAKKAQDSLYASLRDRVDELQATRAQLKEANDRLSTLYVDIREDAQELSRINRSKEKYIADVFAICSDYINKIDEFRKKVNRLIVAGKLPELREMTKNPELSHTELKELYANFDRIFLQIYPDFVKDFNTLLKPDEQIVLKRGEILNTELRIYALVRLGLNDSVKISRFLHCSVQTVYNTRQSIRNKAIIPKEDFAAAVQSLGRFTL